MRLCPLPSPLYTVLMGYKESPVAEARGALRAHACAALGELLRRPRRLRRRGSPAARPTSSLPVPSTFRPGGSPLAQVRRAGGRRVRGLRALLVHATARPRPRAGRPHAAGRRAFAVRRRARARRRGRPAWLLLDDTYVSGARAQSAAGALRAGRAPPSVVVVPLGRVLRPDRSPAHAAFLAPPPPATATAPGRAPCCRCVQTPAPTE